MEEVKSMKLLSIKFNNFNLCKEDLSFSLVPVSKKTLDDKEFELGEIEENLFTFNTTSIMEKMRVVRLQF